MFFSSLISLYTVHLFIYYFQNSFFCWISCVHVRAIICLIEAYLCLIGNSFCQTSLSSYILDSFQEREATPSMPTGSIRRLWQRHQCHGALLQQPQVLLHVILFRIRHPRRLLRWTAQKRSEETSPMHALELLGMLFISIFLSPNNFLLTHLFNMIGS